MDRALDANQPILFEGCIPDGVGLTDVGYFPDVAQPLRAVRRRQDPAEL